MAEFAQNWGTRSDIFGIGRTCLRFFDRSWHASGKHRLAVQELARPSFLNASATSSTHTFLGLGTASGLRNPSAYSLVSRGWRPPGAPPRRIVFVVSLRTSITGSGHGLCTKHMCFCQFAAYPAHAGTQARKPRLLSLCKDV